jgi:hypothetical protein
MLVRTHLGPLPHYLQAQFGSHNIDPFRNLNIEVDIIVTFLKSSSLF